MILADLHHLSVGGIHNTGYRGFLVNFVQKNLSKLPIRQQLLLPKLLPYLDSDTQEKVREHLRGMGQHGGSMGNEESGAMGNKPGTQLQVLQAMVKADGPTLSNDTK